MNVKITVEEKGGRFVILGNGQHMDDYATRKQADREAERLRRSHGFIDLAVDRAAKLVERLLRHAEAEGFTKREARDYIGCALSTYQ